MPKQDSTTRTMTVFEVKKALSSLITEVSRTKARILVEQSGLPVAALVSVDDLERLRALERAWDERTKAIERFSQAFADVPTEEAEAEVARIIAEVRQRRAVEAEAERQTA